MLQLSEKMIAMFHYWCGWRKFGEFKSLKRKYWQQLQNGMGEGNKGDFSIPCHTLFIIFVLKHDVKMIKWWPLPILNIAAEVFFPWVLHCFDLDKNSWITIWFIHSTNNLSRAYYVPAIKWRKKKQMSSLPSRSPCVRYESEMVEIWHKIFKKTKRGNGGQWTCTDAVEEGCCCYWISKQRSFHADRNGLLLGQNRV